MSETESAPFPRRAASQIGQHLGTKSLSFLVVSCALWLGPVTSVRSQFSVWSSAPNVQVTPISRWVPPVSRWQMWSNTWTTIAGSAGRFGYHDGLGNAVRFNQPAALAVDEAGDLYVADSLNHTIRKVSPTGKNWSVNTIAGTPGRMGNADGTNDLAQFNQPAGIALDKAGNLYVADALNNTIRKIAPVGTSWVVTTVAGRPGKSGSADGTNGTARFNHPAGIAADSRGTLYVADTFSHTVRKVTPSGTNWVISTLAGTPGRSGSVEGRNALARFNQPAGLVVDAAGNLYVADALNNAIRKLRLVGTNSVEVTTIVGQAGTPGCADGTNYASRFNSPRGIAVDDAGNLYVTDCGNHTIRKIAHAGTNWVVTTIGGWPQAIGAADGVGCVARFYCPVGIAVERTGGRYYVADCLNCTIRAGGSYSASVVTTPGYWSQTGVSVHASGTKKWPLGTFQRQPP
jgi:secreted PhoX family phosphatase